ncbi:GNAT family N-acetyltransferase [Streptomyces sp. NRRL F-5123]|uniref:GNAT family N-acetyltransferase n=1 Tax=Streptomyces sp. NRRL F-5123 TaxID=1463856 RepID=UPI000B1691AA|nr:N-acetyltransferase [Streptomyces sp. NRRL F-5123]
MSSPLAAPPIVRRADPEDADALVELRALMLTEMGMAVGGADAHWRVAARSWYAEHLVRPGEFAAFVVDDPEAGVVSSAVGTCDRHTPGPTNLSGLHGHVSNVSTHPDHRRRGHARACLAALLDWFATSTEARVINLNATGQGIGLYQSLGFDVPRHPALQLRL